MNAKTPFQELMERMAELADIGGALALMGWDQETYMPEGSQQARGQQMATLSAIAHQKFTDPHVGQLLERLQGADASQSSDERLTVERVAFDYQRETRIPEWLVRQEAEAQSASLAVWIKARQEDNYPLWRPHLEKLLDLERQKADFLRSDHESRYDLLLQSYERGMNSERIRALFDEIKKVVVPLVQKIKESSNPVSTACLHQHFDIDKQWQFGLEVLKAMGFDLKKGRQDKSAHPFTTSFHPTDVRLTTRLMPDNLRPALFASIHEGGHGLYEQGISPDDYRTPLGSAISLGIHESQSRMWENLIGQSLSFWKHFLPRLQETFPDQLSKVSVEEFYRAVNEVRPSLIRVEADEVTYSLHIILRFEIETDLLEGKLSTNDLPEVWRSKMKEYLGLDVPTDREGCLQDVHWAHGMVGYFPTYTLGNLNAAQLFNQIKQEMPDLDDKISSGNLIPIREWLREKVHQVGRRYLPGELIEAVTGKPLSTIPYLDYLQKKYQVIYGI